MIILLELATGGELFSRISRGVEVLERDAARWISELLLAVDFLHSAHGIIHRDLKPENMLLATPARDAPLKLTDFGTAKKLVDPSDGTRTPCGSLGYAAPEQMLYLRGQMAVSYGRACDIWSVGITAYTVLSGTLPFNPRSVGWVRTVPARIESGLAPKSRIPALSAAGIDQPTEVQRAAFEMILSGEDAVLLSETGSGKTLAYTLPLIHRLIELAELPEAIEADSDEPEDNRRRTVPDQALVLVPNRDLAAQVHDVIAGVVETLPDHLKKTISVSSLAAETGADASAAILVSTPAIALKAWRGPETVRWVVLDEADALLAGSWKLTARMNYPIELLIAQVKRAAKLEASATPVPTSRTGGRAGRAKAFYSTRQFVVTGATMPNAGTKNMEEHVQRLLPTAQWFLAERVHKSIDRVKHFFIKIDGDFRAQALQQALKHGPPGKVLIFANTLEMAETAHADASLELGSDGCALFHAGLSTAERADILAAFGRAEPPVLVCTGLASRGIDFTDVAHVLQYDVAHNAVEFMHRVGRTARAGKAGIATTLYTDDRAELIEGIRDALADGSSINHLFSRKRSFTLLRKKARKRDAQMSVALGLEEADDDDDVNLRRNRADKDARRRAKHAAMLDQLGDQ